MTEQKGDTILLYDALHPRTLKRLEGMPGILEVSDGSPMNDARHIIDLEPSASVEEVARTIAEYFGPHLVIKIVSTGKYWFRDGYWETPKDEEDGWESHHYSVEEERAGWRYLGVVANNPDDETEIGEEKIKKIKYVKNVGYLANPHKGYSMIIDIEPDGNLDLIIDEIRGFEGVKKVGHVLPKRRAQNS